MYYKPNIGVFRVWYRIQDSIKLVNGHPYMYEICYTYNYVLLYVKIFDIYIKTLTIILHHHPPEHFTMGSRNFFLIVVDTYIYITKYIFYVSATSTSCCCCNASTYT